MKYADIARAALVLALGMMTSAVLAYSEAFENISTETNLLEAAGVTGWTGGADDISTVVAGKPDEPKVGYPLPAANHTKVLQLNTEGGTLTNSLAPKASFEFENVYVDSMVKFVPSEDLASFEDKGIKVALYAYISENGENVSTNLAVYHGAYNKTISPSYWLTNTVTALPINTADWYRLSIVLANGSGDTTLQAFKVFINGVPITNTAAYKDDWSDVVNESPGTPNEGPWFLSAAWENTEAPKKVETLQFKGTGFVDDLVVGTGDPFAQGEPEGFQVTQNIGANGSCSDTNSPITVTGVSTTLTYTADDFYEIASLTTNGVDVANAVGKKSKAIDIYSATAVTSSFAIVSGYTAGNVSWFQDNGWGQDDIVPGLPYAQLQMLNVAPTNAAARGTITIEAIEVVGDDVKVTVFIDRTMSLGADIVGTLKLYGATTLEGGFTEIGSGVTIGGDLDGTQDDIRKDITFPNAGDKKFFKAVIE